MTTKTVRCQKCNRLLGRADIETTGIGRAVITPRTWISGPGLYSLHCRHCGHRGDGFDLMARMATERHRSFVV